MAFTSSAKSPSTFSMPSPTWIAHEANDFDRRARYPWRAFSTPCNRRLAVDHEDLREQNRLFVEFAHAAFDHLLDDVFRLAGLAGDIGLDGAFALDHFSGEMFRRQRQRGGGRNVHGDLLAERRQLRRVAGGFQRRPARRSCRVRASCIVNIARDDARRHGKRGRAAHAHVLADLGDEFLQRHPDRGAAHCLASSFSTSPSASSASCAAFFTKSLNWSLRATKSVSELTSTSAPESPPDGNADQTFGGNAAGLLRGLRQALLAQPIDRRLHVAIGFGQGRLCNPSCLRRSCRAGPSPSLR